MIGSDSIRFFALSGLVNQQLSRNYIKLFDKDNNLQISAKEFTLDSSQFKSFDSNFDNQLSESEISNNISAFTENSVVYGRSAAGDFSGKHVSQTPQSISEGDFSRQFQRTSVFSNQVSAFYGHVVGALQQDNISGLSALEASIPEKEFQAIDINQDSSLSRSEFVKTFFDSNQSINMRISMFKASQAWLYNQSGVGYNLSMSA